MMGVVLSASVLAQPNSSSLSQAIELFVEGDYLGCQEALINLDRSKLSAQDQTIRDDYLTRVQVAITMYEKALRDLEDAETALDDDEPDHARRLLDRVLANEYAAEALRRAAVTYMRQLDGQPVQGDRADLPPSLSPNMAGVTPQSVNRARTLTGEGDDAVGASRYDDARRLYQQALNAVPGYPEAVAGLQRVRDHQQVLTGTLGNNLIERIRQDNLINWQRTVAEYRDLEEKIRSHMAGNRFEQAHQLLIRSEQVVETGRQYADPIGRYDSLRNELKALQSLVAIEERNFNDNNVARVRAEIETRRKEQLEQVAKRRALQVDVLMSQAMQHRKDGDLPAAINVLRQVIAIDPKNQPARWSMDMLVDLNEFKLGRKYREQFYREQQRVLNDVEEAKIPWHQDTQRYPDNWLELISRPDRRRPGERRPDAQLYGLLERKVPVDFVNDPFDQVIEQLATNHKINIIVNWNDLKRAGVDRDIPIDLSLPRNLSLKKILSEALEQAGAGLVELGYDVQDGAVKIATRQLLDHETFTAVYDIQDLLMEIPIFRDAPNTDLNKLTRSLKPNPPDRPWLNGDDDDDEPEEDPGKMARIRKIINLIQDTVAPESWIEHGGTVGSIHEINDQLVITQNTSGQRSIGNLLGKLRDQRAIQIAVEARFITVSSHYLEELGIDIDIVLNAGNAGFDFVPGASGALTDPILGNQLLLPRSFSRLGFTPAVPALGGVGLAGTGALNQPFGLPVFIPPQAGGGGSQLTPIPIMNRVSSITSAAGLGSDVPGSFAGQNIGPAFTLFGSFLDNIQVDFLIRATQADSRTSVLTAPRLVLMNGQRAWVAVTIQQNFVGSLQPVVATGAVAQAPIINTIDSGAVLDVTATISANKRYVTMTLRPGVTRLLDLQTFPFGGGAAGGGFGGSAGLNGFVQLPTLSSQRLQTTVSIPDGGTLLIGGQKLASETEIEAGVPILSKIPILKRMYTSRTLVKDEQTLLILIKPKILIQPEQEEIAFPTFGRN